MLTLRLAKKTELETLMGVQGDVFDMRDIVIALFVIVKMCRHKYTHATSLGEGVEASTTLLPGLAAHDRHRTTTSGGDELMSRRRSRHCVCEALLRACRETRTSENSNNIIIRILRPTAHTSHVTAQDCMKAPSSKIRAEQGRRTKYGVVAVL